MPRTTEEAVARICEVDEDLLESLTDCIDIANELVTELPASVMQEDGVTPYHAAPRLEKIERYLAAHFYCILDPRATIEQADLLQTNYETNKVDFDLRLTRYGQQAIALDTTGKLAGYNNALKTATTTLPGVGIRMQALWLGSPANDE
jgi:hypothetical protein